MRRIALFSSLAFAALGGFAASSHADTITTLKNPTTWRVTLGGAKYEPTDFSKCADLSDARNWNKHYWCPVSVGSLSAAKVAELNSAGSAEPAPNPGSGGSGSSGSGSSGFSVVTLNNPTPWRVTLSGTKYEPSNYSKCSNQSDARMWNNYYWCPVSVGSLSAGDVAKLGSGSAKPSNPSTPAPAPSNPSTPAPIPAPGNSDNSNFSVVTLNNPTPWRVTLSGTKYEPSNYSKCSNQSDARMWNKYYWCPVSVGSLSAAEVASLGGGSKPAPTNPTVPGTGNSGGGTGEVPVTHTAKLNWTAPSTREDGAPLKMSEIRGYEIYYTSDDLKTSITVPVNSGSATSHAVNNLKAGTYHFAISAIDSNGLKSELSKMVSTKVGS